MKFTRSQNLRVRLTAGGCLWIFFQGQRKTRKHKCELWFEHSPDVCGPERRSSPLNMGMELPANPHTSQTVKQRRKWVRVSHIPSTARHGTQIRAEKKGSVIFIMRDLCVTVRDHIGLKCQEVGNTGLQFIMRKYRRARVLAVIFSARQHRPSTGPCTEAGLFLRTMALFGLHWSGMAHFTGCCPPPSVDTAPPVSPAAFNLFPPQPLPAHTTPTYATGTGAAIRVCAHRGPRVWEPVMSTLQEYTFHTSSAVIAPACVWSEGGPAANTIL